MSKYQINTICDLNLSSISRADGYSEILYLDTGSITNNVISGIQKVNRSDAPSRAQRKVKDSTIIYSTVRPNLRHYGFLHNPPENFIVSTGFTTIDVKESYRDEISPLFLFYLLTRDEVVEYLHGIAENSVSSYPSINPTDIGNLTFDFPDYEYQCKAAHILEVIDQKIRLNERIFNESSWMAQELYDYYFIQFDFPDENGHPYKSNGGSMQWNERLKRDIPTNWVTSLV